MIKRKPGRPRKTVETFAEEFAAREKRPYVRRKKQALEAPVESKSMLSHYTIETGTLAPSMYMLEADGFYISATGNLIVTRAGEGIASFRQWLSIVKQHEAVEPPKVTLSEGNAAPQSYQGQQQAAWSGSFDVQPEFATSINTCSGLTSVSIGFSGQQSSSPVEIVEADRPE